MRKLVPETTLVWFSFFYLCLGYQWISQTNPEWEEVDRPLEPENEFLKFFISTFLLLCVVCTQVIINAVLINTSTDPDSLNFADICILANCSVLIMTDKFHGYYIHGKAPWSKSDLPMAWLKMELDMEADNRRGPRAYAADQARANQDDKQAQMMGNTYEVFMQPNLRNKIDGWRKTQLERMDHM